MISYLKCEWAKSCRLKQMKLMRHVSTLSSMEFYFKFNCTVLKTDI